MSDKARRPDMTTQRMRRVQGPSFSDRSKWTAFLADSPEYRGEEDDPTLHCDYACLRAGCRRGCEFFITWTIERDCRI